MLLVLGCNAATQSGEASPSSKSPPAATNHATVPTAGPTQAFELTPISIHRDSPEDGYERVAVRFAVQNNGTTDAPIVLPDVATLSITEGRSYDATFSWLCRWRSCDAYGVLDDVFVSPGVSICGVAGSMFGFESTVAQQTTPATLDVPGIGTYSLAGLGEDARCPPSNIHPSESLPLIIEISDSAGSTGTLTFDTLSHPHYDDDGFRLVISGYVRNDSRLDPLAVPPIGAYGITTDGLVGLNVCNAEIENLGPSQQSDVQLCLPEADGARGRFYDYGALIVTVAGTMKSISPGIEAAALPPVESVTTTLERYLFVDGTDGYINQLEVVGAGAIAFIACADVTFVGYMEGEVVQPYQFFYENGSWRVLDTFHNYFTSDLTMDECITHGQGDR